jgi:hypothetical protein
VFAVKFCLALHRKQPDRYKLVTNFGDPIPVLKTVVCIMLDILNKKPGASFAFIGMPRQEENLEETTRYCVYREFCKRYFNPASFDHIYDEKKSFYALLNKQAAPEKTLKELAELAKQELKEDFTAPEIVSLSGSMSRRR